MRCFRKAYGGLPLDIRWAALEDCDRYGGSGGCQDCRHDKTKLAECTIVPELFADQIREHVKRFLVAFRAGEEPSANDKLQAQRLNRTITSHFNELKPGGGTSQGRG
ncbi:MAG: hypothetical protein Q9174_004067 [Haloplaca sp. 1 TL-2023]